MLVKIYSSDRVQRMYVSVLISAVYVFCKNIKTSATIVKVCTSGLNVQQCKTGNGVQNFMSNAH